MHLQLHNRALNSLGVFIHQIAVHCADFLIFAQCLILNLLLGLSTFRLHSLLSSCLSPQGRCGVRENHCLFLFFGVYFTRDILWQIDFASDHSSGSGKTFWWEGGFRQLAIWIVGTSLIFVFQILQLNELMGKITEPCNSCNRCTGRYLQMCPLKKIKLFFFHTELISILVSCPLLNFIQCCGAAVQFK